MNRVVGGTDELFLHTDSSGSFAPLTDALGNVLALTDSTGTITTRYVYDPFGGTSALGPNNNSAAQYVGRENDGVSLYYYRARYYSPTFGRFLSEDPLGLAAGINAYIYADDNPISFSDPSGMSKSFGSLSKTLNQCAAKLSQDLYNSYNPVRGNAVADAIYSNSFADASKLILGTEDEGGDEASNLTKEGGIHAAAMVIEHAPEGAAALNSIAVDGGATQVLSSTGVQISHSEPILKQTITFGFRNMNVGDTAMGSTISSAGKWLGKSASFVGSVLDGKLVIDAGVYLGAEAVCAFF